jgi:hypothetical protein
MHELKIEVQMPSDWSLFLCEGRRDEEHDSLVFAVMDRVQIIHASR